MVKAIQETVIAVKAEGPKSTMAFVNRHITVFADQLKKMEKAGKQQIAEFKKKMQQVRAREEGATKLRTLAEGLRGSAAQQASWVFRKKGSVGADNVPTKVFQRHIETQANNDSESQRLFRVLCAEHSAYAGIEIPEKVFNFCRVRLSFPRKYSTFVVSVCGMEGLNTRIPWTISNMTPRWIEMISFLI